MENPVDHTVDLGLVNYVKHPTNPDYIVYRFAFEDRAAAFEKRLQEKDIWFEKTTEQRKQRTYTLFGIHKNDYKQAQKINFEVEGKFKKPFLPYKGFRYFMLLLSATMIILAIIGYCKAQNKLASYNEEEVSINRSK